MVATLTAAAAIGGPIMGIRIDRSTAPKGAFLATMVIMAAGLIGLAIALGRAPLAWIFALALVAGLGTPVVTGALSAQLPSLLSATRLPRAYSADAATYSVAALVAPPAAAALVVVSAQAPLWLTAALVVGAIAALPFVPLPQRRTPRKASVRADIRTGMDALIRRPALRRSTILTSLGFAAQAPFIVLAPVLAIERFDDLELTALILGAFAIGGGATAVWFTLRPIARPDRAIIVSVAVSAVALLAVGLAPTLPALLAAAFIFGAAEPPALAAMFRVRVRETPSHVHSQVFTTAATLRITGFAIVTALSGWLLGWGVAWVVGFGVLVHIVALIVGVATGPTLPPRHHWWSRG